MCNSLITFCQPLSFVTSYAGPSLLCCCSWLNSTVFITFVFRWCVFCLFVGVWFVDFKTAHFLLVEVCLCMTAFGISPTHSNMTVVVLSQPASDKNRQSWVWFYIQMTKNETWYVFEAVLLSFLERWRHFNNKNILQPHHKVLAQGCTVIIKWHDSTVDRFNQQITHHSLFDLF